LKVNEVNLIIAGIGGQGVLLASEIIAETLVRAGYDVKMSVAYGMAQRGSPIVSHIRAGKKIYSPLISKGQADIVIVMDMTGTQSWIDFLKKDSQVFMLDKYTFSPMAAMVSHKLKRKIKKKHKEIIFIPYDKAFKDLKDIKTLNVFMIGVLSNYFSIKKENWIKIIRKKAPPRIKNINIAVFKLGRQGRYC